MFSTSLRGRALPAPPVPCRVSYRPAGAFCAPSQASVLARLLRSLADGLCPSAGRFPVWRLRSPPQLTMSRSFVWMTSVLPKRTVTLSRSSMIAGEAGFFLSFFVPLNPDSFIIHSIRLLVLRYRLMQAPVGRGHRDRLWYSQIFLQDL